MNEKKAICIYGASSNDINPIYKEAAREVGSLIAKAGYALVSGGGATGLMGSAIDGALEAGGETVGVLPSFMIERGWQHGGLTRMVETEDMHQRKSLMARLSAAVIALPGGCGTLEELLEIITWRQLNLYRGNVVILNVEGYYDPLIKMLEKTVREGFMREDHLELWRVSTSPREALGEALAPSRCRDFSQKIS